MAQVELHMPKMGESIIEATILNWVKNVGDTVELDETILEIATDKVDSEIPSPVAGTISKILFEKDAVVPIGEVIAYIETSDGASIAASPMTDQAAPAEPAKPSPVASEPKVEVPFVPEPSPAASADIEKSLRPSQSERFYSPLVRNIAAEEGISKAELDGIHGSGMNNRVTKDDILQYIAQRGQQASTPSPATVSNAASTSQPKVSKSVPSAPATAPSGNVEIVEMDRMRKLIAKHMVDSVQTSPHVTSYVEADVTNLVRWRNKIKKAFQEKHGEKITFTPIFIEAIAKAIRDFPMINVSVDGDNILVKKDINIGMAAALPSGNLIVPVIQNADHLNLVGLTRSVNDLASRARNNQLKPHEIQGGTFTLTNVGTFGNVMGTPIINQPQVAILAAGAIRKKPAVLETEHGDVIAIRHMMFLSHSYDHRVVDGMLGGSFVRRVADYLEAFDENRNDVL